MPAETPFDRLPPPLAAALEGRGFTALTAVQEAVLDPALAGCDLRICSQTGSGKTVAIGLVVAVDLLPEVAAAEERVPPSDTTIKLMDEEAAALVDEAPPAIDSTRRPVVMKGAARPTVILIAPTRELAAQLSRELGWLYAGIDAQVVTVTGGTSYGMELRSLRSGPRVVVGTPGRLLDHLDRGSIDASGVRAMVLDEADQMLDLGFRDDLESILARTPADRRTHLVSATFSRDVLSLANRYQRSAILVNGASPGERNTDITHVAHLVRHADRDAALINILLLAPGERALVFVRTRDGAATLADDLSSMGLPARALHGDLNQRDRTRTLDAFRSGQVTTLVATDVAARGLDVPDVGRVIHADPPGDSEALTHRSGRTGRAGRKGVSVALIPPNARELMTRHYRRARIDVSWEPAPSPADVYRAADARLLAELTATRDETTAPAVSPGERAQAARLRALAEKLVAEIEPTELVTQLLARVRHAGPVEPRAVGRVDMPQRRDGAPSWQQNRNEGGSPNAPWQNRNEGGGNAPWQNRNEGGGNAPWQSRNEGGNAPAWQQNRNEGGGSPNAPWQREARDNRSEGGGREGSGGSGQRSGGSFVPFRINWGDRHGADPRRLLAMVCRRGGIEGNQVGAIRIGDSFSTFEVASTRAVDFADAVRKPDTRDPRIRIDQVIPDEQRAARLANTGAAPESSSAPRAATERGSAPPGPIAEAASAPKPRVVDGTPPPKPTGTDGGFAPRKRVYEAGSAPKPTGTDGSFVPRPHGPAVNGNDAPRPWAKGSRFASPRPRVFNRFGS